MINLLATNIRIANSRADVRFISFWFAIQQQFRAEISLLNCRIKISAFCSFTVLTFQRKIINCPAIGNTWTLHAISYDIS
jgi:hypothetical protein